MYHLKHVVVVFAALIAACGSLGRDASAILAAERVVMGRLDVSERDVSMHGVLEHEGEYYLVDATVHGKTEVGGTKDFHVLVVVAVNSANGMEYRWHPGDAIQWIKSPGPPSQAELQAAKDANRWGEPIDWSATAATRADVPSAGPLDGFGPLR